MKSLTIPVDRGATAGTVRAFRLLGVPVRLHFTFVLLLLFLVVTALGYDSTAIFATFMLGLFASVLLHEGAHAAVGAWFKIRTVEIVMFPIGGLSRMERRLRPVEELWISLAGPLANLVVAMGIFWYVASTKQPISIQPSDLLHPSGGKLLPLFGFANLLLAGFNLVPAFPMDGGRLLRALLTFLRPEDEATRIAAWMGRVVAFSLGLYGLVTGEFMLVFFAFFIWLGAAQESAAATGRTLTNGIPVRAAMITEFHHLEHGDTVRDAANLLLSTSQQDFPVMHGDEVIGLLDRNRLLKALAAEGPDAYVSGVMDRDYLALEPAADLAETLPLMARGRCALVQDGSRLVGLLTTDNLSEFLLLRRFGMEPVI
ncbi:MAG: site-2 protease family protein [Acidobacteriia bacterium]|nr:site-2 protease family protein [Terriglobia bacterium]